MVRKRRSLPGPTDPPPARAKGTAGSKGSRCMLLLLSFLFFFLADYYFIYEENAVPIGPIRRSERTTRGQGGDLQQKQAVSEAVQPQQGLPKQKRSHVEDIPSHVVRNPMAPAPPKRSKRSKVDVSFSLFQIFFNY